MNIKGRNEGSVTEDYIVQRTDDGDWSFVTFDSYVAWNKRGSIEQLQCCKINEGSGYHSNGAAQLAAQHNISERYGGEMPWEGRY